MQTEELDVALDELETRLERLRALYEQYFLGIEKIEPSVARKDVDRRIWLLRREKIRNTAKRFRLQTIIQRYNTYQQYWQRILREIEAGTYRRHLLKAEKQFGAGALTIAAKKRVGLFRRGEDAAEARAQQQQATQGETDASQAKSAPPEPRAPDRPARDLGRLDLDLDFAAEPTQALPHIGPVAAASVAAGLPRPVPPPIPKRPAPAALATPLPANPPRPPSPPAPAPAAPQAPRSALSEEKVRELYDKLVAAKREAKDDSAVSVDRLGRSLREVENRLKEKHGGRNIDFDVVIKDGKAVVKPVLK